MDTDFEVGIIGAGFAGLVAALRLKKSGRESFIIFERASEVGGTWRDNIYPGCACDIASPLYSFAGEPNPEWSKLYSEQPEILTYIKNVAAKNKLYEHIRFESDIIEARFLEDDACWQVTDREGRTCTVAVLLLGMGPLNRPHIPQLPGLEEYKGKYFHSSQWDTEIELKGKKVAVVGTGASAIQVIPNIAPFVEQLTVIQRSPAWISPRFDKRFSQFTKSLFRHFPLLQKLQREAIYWLNEFIGLGFTGNKWVNRFMLKVALRKLKKEVENPEIRKKLKPNYTIGCKRILRSDDYYPTFNRQNVRLVTAAAESFTAEAIKTADGAEHQVDAVIFATGFVAADINFYTKIIGRGGRDMVEEWKEKGAEAFLGSTVSGYPNLAIILGPNTGLGHNSVIHMMESQMNYIMQYVRQLEKEGAGSFLDLKKEVQDTYNYKIQQQFNGTVWNAGCKSWYTNKKGKNTTLFPRLTVTFRKETKKFNPKAYQLVKNSTSTSSLRISPSGRQHISPLT